jgi:hypothetical protein
VKRLFFFLQLGFFIVFNFFLLLTVYQLAGPGVSIQGLVRREPHYNHIEEFDSSLTRLNSLNKMATYCDSLYSENTYTKGPTQFEESYPDVVSSIVRKRFYHGYSYYGYKNNFLAQLVAKFSLTGLNAIVIPDDILQYSYAACSQQSIVFMEILKRKGFITRKVGFNGKASGHFCFEVYYDGAWHFCDPDMEPDTTVLNAYNRPGIAFLVHHPGVLLKAYHQYPAEKVLNIFPNYTYGAVNAFAAPKAIIFQQVTKFFSYSIWLFFLIAFIWTRRKYKQLSRAYVRNNRIYISPAPPRTSPGYYPNYSASGA